MKITREMLDIAMKKAVEAGLLPRHARYEDVATHEELIRSMLQAALEAIDEDRFTGGGASLRSRASFPDVVDIRQASVYRRQR
jgi:hypothetical protein